MNKISTTSFNHKEGTMPLKTNIGVSRKVADNNYGSRGASVNLEVELDSTLINEPERFHDRIRQVFRLAQQAIDEELDRQQGNGTANHATNGATTARLPSRRTTAATATVMPRRTATPRMAIATARPATPRRKSSWAMPGNSPRASRASASAIWKRSPRRCTTSLWSALTTLDASGLIDTLKADQGRRDQPRHRAGGPLHEHRLTWL